MMAQTKIQNVDDPNQQLFIHGHAYSVGDVIRIDGEQFNGKYIVISTGGTDTLENRAQRRAKQFKRKNKFERYYPGYALRG